VFDDILIGVDGREGGHDAVALAKLLGSANARWTLAHVYGAGLMPGRGAALLLASEREQTRELLEHERERAAIDAELLSCAERSVGRGLRQLTDSHGNDLLVVGRRHHGLFGRAFHSDDTSQALNSAPCPIAIAPAAFATETVFLRRIGVGYDGSPESREAIDVARALAVGREGATVRVLAAIPHRPAAPAGDTDGVALETDDRVALETDDRVALEADDRVALETDDRVALETEEGSAIEVLERFSHELDLLVVGSRSNGPLGRMFNGSTSNHLARNSGCALLVLPRGVVAGFARHGGAGRDTALA